ncbi:hypothetical protein FISHEDRAFT_51179 [Fistulina hepatica ATCC 64428]|uniref:Sulfotransferase domain-containing protein n=1 Tax=Fistulina hepatica ATCC 64428 TaxID=1128425 RepID=A0A0D7A2D0_9AGAR|nr:hypothetical protein FISHEDRAFT_51179 [Fistulina hepatica ATCC 64428]
MKSSVYSQHLPDAAPGSFPPIPPIIDHYLDITNYTHLPPDPPLPVANPTLIPDRLFRTLTPVFTIRHPAHAIPSWYRSVSVAGTLGVSVGDPEWLVITSFLWPRLTFDCFRAHFIAQDPDSRWPVVIDADDLIGDPEGIMRQLCALTGLNPEHISTTWTKPYDPLPVPEDHFMYPLKRALFGSNLKHPPDVTTERQKWASQWGENIADAIARAVDGAMADYQYLYGFRLLPNITK